MRLRLAAVLALLLALLGVGAPLAHAEPSGRISSIASEDGQITATFTGNDLPQGTRIDPESVTVTLDGQELESTAEPITEAVEVPQRTVLLTMDTSGSMADDGKIEAARASALAFLDQLPPEVLVGLVSFADTATLAVPPTTDRAAVQGAIQGLQATGDTALYDAVVLANQSVGTEGIRSVLILSDGEDTASTNDLTAATSASAASGAKVDAIALGDGGTDALAPLGQITAASGGQVVQAADAGQLAEVFDVAAEAITNELLVTAVVPADFPAAEATVAVSAQAGDIAIFDDAFVTVVPPVPSASPTQTEGAFGPIAVPPGPAPFPSWVLYGALAALGVGLAAILWYAFGGRRDEKAEVRGRLAMYSLSGAKPKKQEEIVSTALGDTAAMRSAVGMADKFVKKRDYEGLLGLRLEAAGLPLRPAEWTLIHFGLAILIGILFTLLFRFNLLAGLLGIAIGVLGPFIYLDSKAQRRRNKFGDQLADTLTVMAGSMSAGYSLPQAVDTVVREDIEPISTEFNRALVESRLGVPIEDALDDVAERMQSDDFSWVVMAIRIQRQVGGNLAELLTTVARLLRERERLRRQVRVLSAEGRLSAWILLALPFVVVLFLLLRSPGYLNPLFSDPIGWLMMGIGLVLMIVGVLWIRQVVKVEV
jgi:tight adherence protein B